LNCPTCKTELTPAEVHDVAVSRCATCRGTWFDDAGFRVAKDREDENLRWHDFELWKDVAQFDARLGDRPCPSCGKAMSNLAYGETGVRVDTCRPCLGVWLDESEFENIIVALREEIVAMPALELFHAALEEAVEIAKGPESLASEWKDAVRVLDLLKLRVLVDHPVLHNLLMGLQKGQM
jgi:Zn-finger nucleic acid-binding protein